MVEEKRKVILKTEGLTKHYGGVHALQDADFVLHDGEHVAIVGDNGAGKSTFVRQITGTEIPTSGKIYFDGQLVNFHSPLDARKEGIETVYQNLALADDLDVPSNIFLGREEIYFNLGPFSFLNERKMLEKSKEVLAKTGIKIPELKTQMGNMSGGQVLDLVEKVIVLRQGRIVGEVETAKTDGNEIVSLITGVKQNIDVQPSYI